MSGSEAFPRVKEIAIVGGGVTGTVAAAQLAKLLPSARVTLFDQGRGLGGRASHRRVDASGRVVAPSHEDGAYLAWDHGAQFFRCDTEEFRRRVVDGWLAAAEYVLTDVRSQPFYHHASDAAEGAAAAAQWVHADGVLHLAAFCRLLDKGAGSVPRAYVVGAALTAADIAVFVLVLQLQRLTPLVPAAFPLLAAWFARIQVICSHTRVRIFLAYC